MAKITRADVVWYALRITYGREMALKEYLDTQHIENFIPMCTKYVMKHDKKICQIVPVVHNLIFVHSSRLVIDELKTTISASLPIRYIMNREEQVPLVVPDSQMHHFIAVAGTLNEQLIYLAPTEIAYKKGDRVRVTAGVFAGVEGEIMRIKGDRRIVVSIQGVMAVATAFIHPSLLEFVKE